MNIDIIFDNVIISIRALRRQLYFWKMFILMLRFYAACIKVLSFKHYIVSHSHTLPSQIQLACMKMYFCLSMCINEALSLKSIVSPPANHHGHVKFPGHCEHLHLHREPGRVPGLYPSVQNLQPSVEGLSPCHPCLWHLRQRHDPRHHAQNDVISKGFFPPSPCTSPV